MLNGSQIDSNHVLRLNPNGPYTLSTAQLAAAYNVDTPSGPGPLARLLMSDYEYLGYDVIASDEYEASSIEHPVDAYHLGTPFVFSPIDFTFGRFARPSFGSRLLTTEARDSTMLFRGVADDHPGFGNALQGIAKPRGGNASVFEHNYYNNTRSPWTSWTTREDIAEVFAQEGGVVMRKLFPNTSMIKSPDLFKESEVLIEGVVTGASTRRVVGPVQP